MTTEKLLPTKEALAYAGVSRRYLYTIASPAVRGMGNQPSQWRVADLDAYLKARKGVAK